VSPPFSIFKIKGICLHFSKSQSLKAISSTISVSMIDEVFSSGNASTSFCSMTKYDTIVYTEDNKAILTDLDECLELLKSREYRKIVMDDRTAYLASLRVAQFRDHYDSFKKDPEHQCRCCPAYKTWCMHPGGFDAAHLSGKFKELNFCIICDCQFNDAGEGCEHTMLINDCCMISDGRSFPKPNKRYAAHLARLMRNDAVQKASEDTPEEHGGFLRINGLRSATPNKRKTAVVLERLDIKRDAWMMSCKMTASQFGSYMAAADQQSFARIRGSV
jgi:hypothetical protein